MHTNYALDEPEEITKLVNRWAAGEDPRMEALIPRVYHNLCALARNQLKGERSGNSLQTLALVNELYLQLERVSGFHFENRAHFYGWVSGIMRHILIGFARRKNAKKRRCDHTKWTLDAHRDLPGNQESDPTRLIALDIALERLAHRDPRSVRVVELRFFGGMKCTETAQLLGVSKNTVVRDWEFARRWLSRELGATWLQGS